MTGDLLPKRVEAQPLAMPDPAQPLAVTDPNDPRALLRLGVEKGLDAAGIVKLAELSWKDQDRRAAQEFNDCLMRFQAELPPLAKSKRVDVASNKGSGYSYWFAPLDKIAQKIAPYLRDLGFAYSWDSEIADGLMRVSCTLRHVNGHKESSSFVAPQASGSPAMTTIQKHASSMTYAKRQSLIAVLGITPADADMDGNDPVDPTTITAEQVATLECMADEVKADMPVYLKWLGVDRLEDLYATTYKQAVRGLEAKRTKL